MGEGGVSAESITLRLFFLCLKIMDLKKKKIGENKRGEGVRPLFHSFQTLFHKKNQLYFDVLGNLVFHLFSIVSKKVQNRKKGGGGQTPTGKNSRRSTSSIIKA